MIWVDPSDKLELEIFPSCVSGLYEFELEYTFWGGGTPIYEEGLYLVNCASTTIVYNPGANIIDFDITKGDTSVTEINLKNYL